MVRLLITAVSYISEETAAEYGGGSRKKYVNLQKKGKWKSVSKVMAERGHLVSPQQCEDKFNDLNKRYKRLNEILGRGTSCEVVENPTLLDVMDHIPEKAKDEVRKILSSKHLHYEEMYNDEIDDQDGEFDDHGESEENSGKRVKRCQSLEDFSFRNSLNCNRSFNFQIETANSDAKKVPSEGTKTNTTWKNNWNHQLEEQRLHIEAQMLELEKERFKWQRFCRKKDRELEMARMEIERMKLENERMALELRRKEMGFDDN
ncbi:hypothetical protein DH2020_047340 [Rehmannia glutinosa]|uniref:Myb/SANT-like DNA-binding domain-containing protein n=1 Tax=Rehmannia glutinosa TaxID=99300 RepID=A0ABR0U8U0_REHGL